MCGGGAVVVHLLCGVIKRRPRHIHWVRCRARWTVASASWSTCTRPTHATISATCTCIAQWRYATICRP